MTTPDGVTATWTRHMLADLDPGRGPVGWLMRQDGTQVCWGHRAFDIWDDNALRCECPCHREDDAVGHPYQPPTEPPTGPEAWPAPRDQPPPPPRPVPDGRQLAIDDHPDPARSL